MTIYTRRCRFIEIKLYTSMYLNIQIIDMTICTYVCSILFFQVSKFQPPLAGLMMYNNEHFAQPPPAHMGIPPVHIDPKSGKLFSF